MPEIAQNWPPSAPNGGKLEKGLRIAFFSANGLKEKKGGREGMGCSYLSLIRLFPLPFNMQNGRNNNQLLPLGRFSYSFSPFLTQWENG